MALGEGEGNMEGAHSEVIYPHLATEYGGDEDSEVD